MVRYLLPSFEASLKVVLNNPLNSTGGPYEGLSLLLFFSDRVIHLAIQVPNANLNLILTMRIVCEFNSQKGELHANSILTKANYMWFSQYCLLKIMTRRI